MSTEENAETLQYLTFRLGEETFALEVTQVREVLDLTPITRVPKAPDFMRGVINVRGNVVPVMDMRLKFGMKKTENTLNTRIVVMTLNLDGDVTVLGALADSVHEVIDLSPEQIEDPPKIGARWKTEFIKGVGKRNDEFIILLDLERIFSTDELVILQETGDEDVSEDDDLSEEDDASMAA